MAILMFDFKLVYVPRMKHKGPDRLSRRRATEDKKGDKGIKETKS